MEFFSQHSAHHRIASQSFDAARVYLRARRETDLEGFLALPLLHRLLGGILRRNTRTRIYTLSKKVLKLEKKNTRDDSLSQSLGIICSLLVFHLQKIHFCFKKWIHWALFISRRNRAVHSCQRLVILCDISPIFSKKTPIEFARAIFLQISEKPKGFVRDRTVAVN